MDDLSYSEPSYIHKDSDRISVLIASVIGFCGLAYILQGMYESGIDKVFSGTIFELLVGFSALIGWFFMMLSGLSSIFPIYIDGSGGHYRTLFLRKKNLEWSQVREIIIAKQKSNRKLQYHMMVCSLRPSSLVWGVETYKGDSYEELYEVVDYYVQKYGIKVTLQDRLNNSIRVLDGMPKKLDFS